MNKDALVQWKFYSGTRAFLIKTRYKCRTSVVPASFLLFFYRFEWV